MAIHPAFDPKTGTWFTPSGVEAPTLAELAALLPAGTVIKGYVPLGSRDGMIIKVPAPPARPVLERAAPEPPVQREVRAASTSPVNGRVARAMAKLTPMERQILAMLIAQPLITIEGVTAATGAQPGSVRVLISKIRTKAGVAIVADELGWRMSEEAKAEIALRMLPG